MKNLVYILLLFQYLSIQSQTYEFSVDKSAYEDLQGSTSLTNGELWETPSFEIPIGFDFLLFDTTISTLYMDQGTALYADSFLDTAGAFSAIVPLGTDLIDGDFVDNPNGPSLSDISFVVEDTEEEKIFKLEWKNAGFAGDLEENGTTSDFVNFQIWLYEKSGNIEIHFGENRVESPESFDNGIGPFIIFVNNLDLEEEIFDEYLLIGGDLKNPILVPLEGVYYYNDIENFRLIGTPANGTIYRLSRGSVGVENNETLARAFSVFPNPSTEIVIIKNQNTEAKLISTSLYSSDGKLLRNVRNTVKTLDISDLPEGIYNLKIETDQGAFVKRIVKVENR